MLNALWKGLSSYTKMTVLNSGRENYIYFLNGLTDKLSYRVPLLQKVERLLSDF